MTVDSDAPMTPARALQLWIAVQTLKPVAEPDWDLRDGRAKLECLPGHLDLKNIPFRFDAGEIHVSEELMAEAAKSSRPIVNA